MNASASQPVSRQGLWLVVLLLAAAGLQACAHPISEGLRRQADPELTFTRLLENPDQYIGKTFVLGGTIVATRNLETGSEIEVVQKELSSFGEPGLSDDTGGRFIFVHPGYLEATIFKKGRSITGAGKVLGSRMGKVGEREYRFPLIGVEEIKLWEEYTPYPYYYPYGYPYYYPFHSPFYYPSHRRHYYD
jgi:outer membrane lipoprotein